MRRIEKTTIAKMFSQFEYSLFPSDIRQVSLSNSIIQLQVAVNNYTYRLLISTNRLENVVALVLWEISKYATLIHEHISRFHGSKVLGIA